MASIDWQQRTFKIATENGWEDAAGWVGGPFGVREERSRWRSVWTVTHLSSGLRLTPGRGAGLSSIALAQAFAERLLPLADWSADRALADDHALADRVVAIWNELITLDVLTTNMMNSNEWAPKQPESRAARRRMRR
jgi:hypothetical protein